MALLSPNSARLPNPTRLSLSSGIPASGRDRCFSPQAPSSDTDKVPSFNAGRAPSSGTNQAPGTDTEVFILDEHPPILEAVTAAVRQEEGLQVSGTATAAKEALEAIDARSPGVLITEISLRSADGLGLIEEILGTRPGTKAIVYSILEGERHVGQALRAGARGYVNKSASTKRLIGAVRQVLRGEISLIPDVASQILGDAVRNQKYSTDPSEQLTDRELTVFRMMGRGQSVRSIADQLDLSRKTVETHRRRAKEKLGHATLDGLLRHAIEWGSNK